jgi:type 1 glutamine amidotransferase
MAYWNNWLIAGLAVALAAGNAFSADSEKEKDKGKEKIKVLLLANGGHDGKGFNDTISPVLAKTGDFEVTFTTKKDDLKIDNLRKYNVVMFYGSGGDFPDPNQEKGLEEFVKSGGGMAGVHATDAYKKSDVYWRMMGGRFTGHGGGKFMFRIEDKQHPVTAPMKDFEIQDETYQNSICPKAKLHSLGKCDRDKEQQSMAWVQDYEKGRIFCTTLGDNKGAWTNPNFQQLVVRGLYWSAGRDPKDP